MRRGKRLGVDVGEARVGVASCDPDAILATPVVTLKRGQSDLRKVAKMVRDDDIMEVIVGLPLNMDGTEGISARHARVWAGKLARRIAPVSVRLVDERLSTVSAQRSLREAGRSAKKQRNVIDQAAALEQALARQRHRHGL